MTTIWFVTGNKGKVRECKRVLQKFNITVDHHPIDYPEIQADSLEEVVRFGLKMLQQSITQPFIIEDAGLFIDSLKGFPGVYSKYAYYTIGLKGILQLLENASDRRAVFRSVYGLSHPKKSAMLFIGETKGTIAKECKGLQGFGYDPLFIANGSKKTFAQMSIEEKNQFSHRGKALEKVSTFIQNNTHLFTMKKQK